MFGSIVRRLSRRPWSLALVAGLVVLLGAAFFVAGPGGSSLFGLTVGGCKIEKYTNCPNMDLHGANLTGANLFWAILSNANLSGANLTRSDLSGANLIGAMLVEDNLTGAILTDANLTSANLTSANLRSANLTGADLSGANLQFVRYCFTIMPDGKKRNEGCY